MPRVVAVIPARGESRRIPRMCARLLGGVPLVAHVIRACLATPSIDRVYVTTEDDEVAVIAERFGASVVRRDPRLSEFVVPLAPVVADAVEQIEAAGERFDVVATVQPNNPLIRAASIERGLRELADPTVDSVVSVYASHKFRWRARDGHPPEPEFQARRSREMLTPRYVESGGLIASRRAVIQPDRHVGKSVRLLVLDREEAIDIDTFHDWWLVEKILSRRRIVFHVIGSAANGLGHVYRGLTLARRLSDHEIFFLCSESEDLAARLLGEAGYDVHVYRGSPMPTLAWLEPDIVVNDVLDTDAESVREMKSSGWRVVNFEDLGSGVAEADVVINALYEVPHPSPHVHTGADYYCLREEFFSATRDDTRDEVGRVLVCFGGTDPSRLTLRALEALASLDGSFATDVVLGPGYDDPDGVRRIAAALPGEVEIVQKTKVMSQYMERADLMLTSGGRTVYEAASIGVPTVVLCQNDRELEHLFASPSNGFLNLGLGADVSAERLADEIGALVADPARRKDMQRRMWRWEAHAGIERVLALIVGT